jgi:hypothetical protein
LGWKGLCAEKRRNFFPPLFSCSLLEDAIDLNRSEIEDPL